MRCWVRLYWVAVVAIIKKIPDRAVLGRCFVNSSDGLLDEEGFGIEGEGHLALLVGVVAPRDLQGPLDALGLHHDPEAGGTAASLHRNLYHLATLPLQGSPADNLSPAASPDTLD